MWPFRKNGSNAALITAKTRPIEQIKSVGKQTLKTAGQVNALMDYNRNDVQSGRFRIMLYRFLTDNIPTVHSCIWTWVRLAASPGKFIVSDESGKNTKAEAENRLRNLSERLSVGASGNPIALTTFLAELYYSLFRDGLFGGFLTVSKDAASIDRFIQADPADIRLDNESDSKKLLLDLADKTIDLDRKDFYYIPLNSGIQRPLGRSILQAIPFVSAVEQQLVNDMQKSVHNAGYNRLHIKITPPIRNAGESDTAYVNRINAYFDSTVSLFKGVEVEDNPVTWDNIAIEHVGPEGSRATTNSWFFNHRAMIEEICAGTNLAPFLLGYSYGATTTWSAFKFDMVMRQVRSIQSEVSQFLEWIGNIELALAGLDARCRFEFDNSFTYQATDEANIKNAQIDNLLKLFQA
ncbi:MAG: hypothetical protein ACREBV_05145, partial [Candidatus Zixiibacteriota bacterium]